MKRQTAKFRNLNNIWAWFFPFFVCFVGDTSKVSCDDTECRFPRASALHFDKERNSAAEAFLLLSSCAGRICHTKCGSARPQTVGVHSVEMYWKNIYKGLIER